jgi:hypothetical protein
MRASLILFTISAVVVLTSMPVLANPTMLPKHPGYPIQEAVDPLTGQSLANDPGQLNATGNNALIQAVSFDDTRVMQSLSPNSNEQEAREKLGTDAPQKAREPKSK